MRIRLVIAVAAALVAIAGPACGGSGEDPRRVLAETFAGAGKQLQSGAFELRLELAEEGVVAADAAVSGHFDGSGPGVVPRFEGTAVIEGEARGAPFSFEAGATSTGRALFISYAGTPYRLDDAGFAGLEASLEASAASGGGAAGFFGLGVDPVTWMNDVREEGIEEVGGVETIHLSARPDVETMLRDLTRLARRTGRAGGIGAGQIRSLAGAIADPRVDIYTGDEDRIIRRFEIDFGITGPGAGDAGVSLSFELSGLNEPQPVSAPRGARPLSELGQILDALPGT